MVGRDYIHSFIHHSLTCSFIHLKSIHYPSVYYTELRAENIPGKPWFLSSLNFSFTEETCLYSTSFSCQFSEGELLDITRGLNKKISVWEGFLEEVVFKLSFGGFLRVPLMNSWG